MEELVFTVNDSVCERTPGNWAIARQLFAGLDRGKKYLAACTPRRAKLFARAARRASIDLAIEIQGADVLPQLSREIRSGETPSPDAINAQIEYCRAIESAHGYGGGVEIISGVEIELDADFVAIGNQIFTYNQGA